MCILARMKIEQNIALKSLLENPQKTVIVPHKSPDGDAMGSCLGWKILLEKIGHTATVISPDHYPNFLKWIPGSDEVLIYEDSPEVAQKHLLQADSIFVLDFNSLKRIGDMGDFIGDCKAKKIIIDHHRDPEDFADLLISYPEIGSTCELVYHLISTMGQSDLIDKNIATALYVGILTDTGSFRFPSVTPTTHKVVAHLIECGAEHSEISNKIKDTASLGRLQLLGIALNNLHYIEDLRTAYITLSTEELNSCNYQKGDTEGFVNYGLSIEGSVLAIILIENKQEGYVKMSFRSKGTFSVNDFARTHFNGGGHHNAAGGRIEKSLVETVEYLLEKLELCRGDLQVAY